MDIFISKITDKQFAKEIVQCIEIDDEETINQLIQAVAKIMIEKHPPQECLFGLKLIKDGIEKFNERFKSMVKAHLMELILEVAMYRIKDNDDQRGVSYFKNPEHEKKIDSYGASYIRLALDCVRVWAMWFPDFQTYSQRLNAQNGYLPQINYFKPELIEQHKFKQQQATPTPQDETEQIRMKTKQLNKQFIDLLQAYTEDNDFVRDELATINAQLEDILLLDIQEQFVDDFVLTYQDFQQGKKTYSQLRLQFLSSQQMKQSQKQFQSETYKQQQQQSTIQQQKEQILAEPSPNQANQLKSEYNTKIQSLQKDLQQQEQRYKELDSEYQLLNQLANELQNEIQREKKKTETLEQELQRVRKTTEMLQNENKQLKNKIAEDQAFYQGKLSDNQQQIEIQKNQHQILSQQLQTIPLEQDNQQQQLIVLQLQEELENLKVEKNLLYEQNKQYQERSNQICNLQDYQNLKKRFDELDSKYYLLKQENYKLRQINQEQCTQSMNQSRYNNESINQEFDVKEINQNITFYNFKDSDLWSLRSIPQQSNLTSRQSPNQDISQLIYPHKTAAEYYKASGKKQFRGTLINKNAFPIQLNSVNQINFKKASLNQVATLYQTNKLEIKSRQQIIIGQKKQELISTTLSIKNRDLTQVQIQIINNNNNVWINKETKSTVLQTQQTLTYEFIRESNIRLHDVTQIQLSINFNPTIIYLPILIMNCLKFIRIDASSFRQIKKSFQGVIYKTEITQIVCKSELLQLRNQGQLLNSWEQENDEQITANKFGFKASLCNQLEFYLELIITPCDDFLFRAFTSFDEETLIVILNALSNLYGM